MLASVAIAGGKGPTIEATQFEVDFNPVSELAVCARKERAIGGGVLPIGDPAGTRVLGSGPLDKTGDPAETTDGDVAKQWFAAARNAPAVQDREYKAFAICLTGSDATVEATQFTVDEKEQGAEVAKCGRGDRAIGGGLVPSGDPDGLPLHSTGPLDSSGDPLATSDGDKAKQWYAAIVNEGVGFGRVVTVYAICSSESKAKIEATEFTVDNQESGEETVKCGRGQRAVSGGVVQDGSAVSLRLQASGPLDADGEVAGTEDGDAPRKWFVSIFNGSGVDGRVFRAFALCE